MTYQAVGNLLFGKDHDALNILIPMHVSNASPIILDCTFNKGVMWRKCNYKPAYRMDIRPLENLSVVATFHHLPFEDGIFDAIVFDPPHLPKAFDNKHSEKHFMNYYNVSKEEGDDICDAYVPFLGEAKRVLKKHGIVLAKIADLTHHDRYRWQQVEFVNTCNRMNFTPCDMLVKFDPNGGNLVSSKWVNQYHLRKCHSYWIVARNSKRCERL